MFAKIKIYTTSERYYYTFLLYWTDERAKKG